MELKRADIITLILEYLPAGLLKELLIVEKQSLTLPDPNLAFFLSIKNKKGAEDNYFYVKYYIFTFYFLK